MPTAEKLFVHVAIVLLLSTHFSCRQKCSVPLPKKGWRGQEGAGRGPGVGRGCLGGCWWGHVQLTTHS